MRYYVKFQKIDWCPYNLVSSFGLENNILLIHLLISRIQPLKRMKHFWPLGLVMCKGKMLLQEDVCFYFLLGKILIILKTWYIDLYLLDSSLVYVLHF